MTKKNTERSSEDQTLSSLLKRELPEAPEAPFLEAKIWNRISAEGPFSRPRFFLFSLRGFAGAAGLALALIIGSVIQAPPLDHLPRVAATPTQGAPSFELDLLEDLSGSAGEDWEESYSVYEMI
jgi:hypothetical protein